jgi:ABC-type Fe3+ transport system permease subunit
LILLILYLLPRALLLHLLLRAVRPQEPVFLAEALASARTHRKYGQELLWQLRLRGAFWACVLLCFWAYLDVTATALLRPVGMESAPVLLYNLMHYGQSAVLSAMLFATIAVPLALVLSFVAVRRHFLPWIVR